jgi:integrase
VDPHAGRTRFAEYADRWLASRNDERTTRARDASIMRTHVMPRWGQHPMARIEHLDVQVWVTELGGRLAPATVAECFRLTSSVMRTAMRDRIIGFNPCDGVKVPRRRRQAGDDTTITPTQLTGRLLPAVPDRYRPLVALAGGTGLRWGECAGLRWDAVDLVANVVRVERVAEEVAGTVSSKPYPKSKAGRRTVPLPRFAAELLDSYADQYTAAPGGEIFTNQAGGPVRRTLFRARVWRPALVRAGLLGRINQVDEHIFRAGWDDARGRANDAEFTTERDAVAHVARWAAGGMRFHDLRHSYATWLVSSGVPINDVQTVMGHEQASTTLDRYTHQSTDRDTRVRRAFADDLLTHASDDDPEDDGEPSAEGS